MAKAVKLFFDGGSRPSTGIELAVVAGGRIMVERDLGPGSSMEAEWLALLRAARLANELAIADPVLLGDAAAVIAQATGAVRCPAAHARHLASFRLLAAPLGRWRLRHVKRSHNLAGIALARLHAR